MSIKVCKNSFVEGKELNDINLSKNAEINGYSSKIRIHLPYKAIDFNMLVNKIGETPSSHEIAACFQSTTTKLISDWLK